MIRILFTLISILILYGCNNQTNPLRQEVSSEEILVYASYGMSGPVEKIRTLVREEHGCWVTVVYGMCGYLKEVIEVNKTGDIYVPADSSCIEELEMSGKVIKSIEAGYNTLSFFINKEGRPLTENTLEGVVGNRERLAITLDGKSSLGIETLYLLEKSGFTQDNMQDANIAVLPPERLMASLKGEDADVVINWKSAEFYADNSSFSVPVSIASEYIRRVPVKMGLLRYTVDRSCAEKFIDIAGSARGKELFAEYGFAD